MIARIFSEKPDAGLPALFILAGLTGSEDFEFGAAGTAKEGLVDCIAKEAVVGAVALEAPGGSTTSSRLLCRFGFPAS